MQLDTTVRLDDNRRTRSARPARRLGLPAAPTPLLGRDQLLERAGALLRGDDVRLLTLLGPGGAGKTRLAIELVHSVQEQFDDGACFVDLSSVRDPRHVCAGIAQTLRITAAGSDPTPDDVLRHLQDSDVLVVLDNFEHVLPAAHLVATLLERCPGVKVLATSRTRLCLRWERVLSVPPLDYPVPGETTGVAAIERSPAVRLFVDRARAQVPGFELSVENAAAVAEICARLDGLPLAIEHAAASAGVLSPLAIAERLRHRIDLPGEPPLDLPVRQRTLSSVVEWSYRLLPPELQTLYARLAVFEGGFTPAAADAVCGDYDAETRRRGDAETRTLPSGEDQGEGALSASPRPAHPESGVLAGLQALVDRSLLSREPLPDGDVRFRMAETTRHHAAERLQASDELAMVRRRHAAYFLDLAENAQSFLAGRHQTLWLATLSRDRQNLGAALSWSIQTGDASTGLRLGAALWRFWDLCATAADARSHLDGVLALCGTKPETALHAAALLGAGALAERLANPAVARVIFERSFAIAKRTGERLIAAHAQLAAARAHVELGDDATAQTLCERSLTGYAKEDDRRGEADALRTLGEIAQLRGDLTFAQKLFRRSLRLSREMDDKAGCARALLGLGRCAFFEEDLAGASRSFDQSHGYFREVGDYAGAAAALTGQGYTVLQQDDLAAARSCCAGALTAALRAGDQREASAAFLGCAALAAALDQPIRALRLAGAATALRETIGAPLPARRQDAAAPHLEEAERLLGEDDAEAAYAAGRTWQFEWAVAEAFALAAPPVVLAPSPRPPQKMAQSPFLKVPLVGGGAAQAARKPLTRREREIAVLVAQGFTNRQIAAMLVVSERTVDTHVEHILKKLEKRSRAQVAIWSLEHGLIDQTSLASHTS